MVGSLCLALGRNTLFTLCLCPPRIINRYRRVVRETGRKGGVGATCDELISHPGGIFLVASCLGKRDKLWYRVGLLAQGPTLPLPYNYCGSEPHLSQCKGVPLKPRYICTFDEHVLKPDRQNISVII